MRSLPVVLSLSLLLFACGGDDDTGPRECTGREDCSPGEVCVDRLCVPATDTGTADTGTDAPVDTNPSSDTSVADTGDGCADECSDEEVCIDGACCAAASVCEDICCGGGQFCSFARCVDIGAECLSEEDCNDGEYCESLLGESEAASCGDTTIASGRCLPRPPACPDGTEPDPANPTCVTSCSYTPPAEAFDVMELYSWGAFDGDRAAPNLTDIRNSPIVIQMDDDDCDGRITGRDTADIVVITSPDDAATPRYGELVVLEVDDGALVERWRVPGMHPHTYPAAGNIDGEPGNEIVACLAPSDPDGTSNRNVIALHLVDGELVELWRADPVGECSTVKIADLDQDGTAEIVTGSAVIDGVTGAIEQQLSGAGRAVLMDVDGDDDGTLEIVTGTEIWRLSDGSFEQIADTETAGTTHALVADLEPGGLPEIISVNSSTHTLDVWRFDPEADNGVEMIRAGLDINGRLSPTLCAAGSAGRTRGGGPPTASDVNADGVPDIAVAGGVGYAVLDGARLVDPAVADADTFFWADQTVDCSSAQTGSSVFDFNGDGRAEVLYADEHTFRIYEGTGDGAGGARVLFDACSTNGTILEMPIVADVDADGQADILVVSNARYRACLDDPADRVSGIRVYGNSAGSWVRTRSVWNQHDYHITNVNDDGSIPRVEARNYATEGLNNFRTNRQPGNQFAAADAVLSLEPRCDAEGGVFAVVRNLGEAVLPAGAEVTLIAGTIAAPEEVLGTMVTTIPLYPAQAEPLGFEVPDDIAAGVRALHGQVQVLGGTPECREDNNTSEGLVGSCLR